MHDLHWIFIVSSNLIIFFFFFNDTATTEIYTLSLHDALPISHAAPATDGPSPRSRRATSRTSTRPSRRWEDRKSTRLNSSHVEISYAVFCLKKKKSTKKRRLVRRRKHNVPA